MTLTELFEFIRAHPLIPIIGGLAAAATAGWQVNVAVNTPAMVEYGDIKRAYSECRLAPQCASRDSTKTAPASMQSGNEIVFVANLLASEILMQRPKQAIDPAWDLHCTHSAERELKALGFVLYDVENENAVRGEFNHVHLGVLCKSVFNVAVIYGSATKKEQEQLRVYSHALESRLANRISGLLSEK